MFLMLKTPIKNIFMVEFKIHYIYELILYKYIFITYLLEEEVAQAPIRTNKFDSECYLFFKYSNTTEKNTEKLMLLGVHHLPLFLENIRSHIYLNDFSLSFKNTFFYNL